MAAELRPLKLFDDRLNSLDLAVAMLDDSRHVAQQSVQQNHGFAQTRPHEAGPIDALRKHCRTTPQDRRPPRKGLASAAPAPRRQAYLCPPSRRCEQTPGATSRPARPIIIAWSCARRRARTASGSVPLGPKIQRPSDRSTTVMLSGIERKIVRHERTSGDFRAASLLRPGHRDRHQRGRLLCADALGRSWLRQSIATSPLSIRSRHRRELCFESFVAAAYCLTVMPLQFSLSPSTAQNAWTAWLRSSSSSLNRRPCYVRGTRRARLWQGFERFGRASWLLPPLRLPQPTCP